MISIFAGWAIALKEDVQTTLSTQHTEKKWGKGQEELKRWNFHAS
jgi:hypothetical protein